MAQKILAAWQKSGSNKTLILSLPSSQKEGEYLISVSLQKNRCLIIAHECPASKCKKECWHVDAAYQAYRQWRWWEDYSQLNVIKVNQKIKLAVDWEQIPIPGEPIHFGTREEGTVHAS